MTPERFEILAEAYGGDVARWPAAEREAAAELMAARPAWAQAILAHAGELDAALDTWPGLSPSGALAEAIAATAPARTPRPAWRAWVLPAGMGAGLAAACAAGVILGVQLAAPAAGDADPVMATMTDDLGYDLYEAAG
jgi:hypothetical protein